MSRLPPFTNVSVSKNQGSWIFNHYICFDCHSYLLDVEVCSYCGTPQYEYGYNYRKLKSIRTRDTKELEYHKFLHKRRIRKDKLLKISR